MEDEQRRLDGEAVARVAAEEVQELLQGVLETSSADEDEARQISERLQVRVDYLSSVDRSVMGTVRTTNIFLEQRIRNHQHDMGTLLAGLVHDSLHLIEGRTVPDVNDIVPATPPDRTDENIQTRGSDRISHPGRERVHAGPSTGDPTNRPV